MSQNRPDEGSAAAQGTGKNAQQEGRLLDRLQGMRESGLLISLAPYLVLLVVILGMTIGNVRFLSGVNLATLVIQSAALLIMALGCTFVILMGSIDLSFGEIANWVSVIMALTVGRIGYLAFPLGVLAGAFAGFLNGVLFVKGRMPSLIVTLGTMGLWSGLAFTLSGGPPVEMSTHANYLAWVTGKVFGIPNEGLIGFGLVVVLLVVQRYTWYGRCIYAIGAGEEVARLSGVAVDLYKIVTFVLAGICAGIGGIVLAARIVVGSPVLSTGYLLYVLAAVVVGGTALSGGVGGVQRTMVGALIITVLRNGMNVVGVNIYAQQLLLGAILVASVILTIDRTKMPVIK